MTNTTYRHGDTDTEMHEHEETDTEDTEMHEHGETDTGDTDRGAHRHETQKQGCRVSDLVNTPCYQSVSVPVVGLLSPPYSCYLCSVAGR